MKKARKQFIINTAIRTILRSKIKILPINLHEVCKSLNIKMCRYSESKDFVEMIKHDRKNNAFAFPGVNNIFHIFYDDEKIPYEEIRKDIAHEIGHIVLKHTSILNYQENEELEKEADLCAKHILIPTIILKKCNMFTPEHIMIFCETTGNLANEIYKDNKSYITDKVNEKLQKFLIKKFKDFINFYNQ